MTEKFEVLDDRNHVLRRSGVYIGSCTPEAHTSIINYKVDTKVVAPGLLKIISEIIDNATDEYVRTAGKFANKIDVSIKTTIDGTEVMVADNGRGIPQDVINGKPRPVLAWTELRAGSNFDDSTRIGAGTNGMGSALTSIFSESFIGVTSDGKNTLTVTCSDNMSKISYSTVKSKLQGTTVTFVPDLTRFSISEFTQDHEDMVLDRLRNLAITYRDIQYTFNGAPIKFKTVKEIGTAFSEHALTFEFDNTLMVFAPMGNQDHHILSCVNGINIKNGGTHVDFILNKVIEAIRANILKKHKIDVMPAQIKPHILFASWIANFPALKFDSQTKERVTNSVAEVTKFLSSIDFDKISKKIIDTPEIVDPIIQAILYKKELEEARALAKKNKDAKKKLVVNHIAATDPNPENRRIFLCEGLSAIAGLINVRDSKTMGGYPLKGKVLNIHGMRPLEILKNKEIEELLSVIGLNIGLPAENLNYGKIVIWPDSDHDGMHIYALLINLFSLWPELFEQRRILKLRSPLYHCVKGKQEKLFYNEDDFEKFDSSGWVVDRFKGLGSMSEKLYSICVNEPIYEVVTEFDQRLIDMAFSEDSEPRKIWMME